MEEYGRVESDGVRLNSCFLCCCQESTPTNSGIRINYKPRMTCDGWHTMSCAYFVFLTLLLMVVECTGRKLPPVHWNSSNPMFKTSNNDHIIEVMMGDLLDFTCPYYTTSTDPMYQEHYIVYQVSRQEYDNCNFYADSTSIMIVNCSKPRKAHRYTIYFEDFIAVPNAPEFKAGETYYYITTSTGYKDGLTNTDSELGACHTRNMRLSIKVCCDTTTSPTTTTTTSLLPTNSSGGASPAGPSDPPSSSSAPPPGGEQASSIAASAGVTAPTTTTARPPVPTTRRQHHSTTRWRSSTRFTKKPGGNDNPDTKPTGKPSDKDNNNKGENDTNNPQTGGQDGANRSASPVSYSSVLLFSCSVIALSLLSRTR